MGDSFSRLPASAMETVVLAFDMSNYSAGGIDGVKKAIKSPQVKKAITEALQNQAKSQVQSLQASSPTVTPKAGAPTGTGSGPASSSTSAAGGPPLPLGAPSASTVEDAIAQLKLNPNFNLLVDDLKKLQASFEKSIVGVWVDENKNTLIIIAAGIAVAAATSMYFTKSGDTVAAQATKLASGQFTVFKLGKLEFGVGDPKFVPSTSTVGGTMSLEVKNLKFIKDAELDVTVTHSAAGMQNGGVAGKVTVAVNHDFSITAKGNIDPIAQIKGVRLGIDYDNKGIKVGVFADVTENKGAVTQKAGLAASVKSGRAQFGLNADLSKAGNGPVATTTTATFGFNF